MPKQWPEDGSIQRARQLEADGQVERALAAYQQGARWRDAARLLNKLGRYQAAADAALQVLPITPTAIADLNEEQRGAALDAALYFWRAKDALRAASLMSALGQNRKAAKLLWSAGEAEAAQQALKAQPLSGSPWMDGVLHSLGPAESLQVAERASQLATVGRSEAAETAFVPAEILDDLAALATEPSPVEAPPVEAPPVEAPPVEVHQTAQPTRRSGLLPGAEAVRSVQRLLQQAWRWPQVGSLPAPVRSSLLTLLAQLLNSALRPSDAPLLYALGRLFEFHDQINEARAAFGAISSRWPDYVDAARRDQQLEQGFAYTREGSWLPAAYLGSWAELAPLPHPSQLPGPILSEGLPGAIEGGAASISAAPSGGERDLLAVPLQSHMALPAMAALREEVERLEAAAAPAEAPAPDLEAALAPYSAPALRWAADEADDRALDHAAEGGLSLGTLIHERYRIEEVVGRGAMATVYKARDDELQETIALKVFRKEGASEEGLKRFRREMKISRSLHHPNIANILEFGSFQGFRFITMEFLEGRDLSRWMLDHSQGVPLRQALRFTIDAARGLAAAHGAGIIHRDVKPANLLLLEPSRRIKVMDFGIAKEVDAKTLSAGEGAVGTPHYMAPEQIDPGRGPIGPATDFYALGGVLYELVTGKPPFAGASLVKLLMAQLEEVPPLMAARRPDLAIPPRLDATVHRMLLKMPQERHGSAAALLGELEQLLAMMDG